MLYRNFVAGRMNLDADERTLSPGEYREAYNFIVRGVENSDQSAGKNSDGNTQLYNIDFGPNAECVGGAVNEASEKIYLLIRSDTLSAILEWDERNQIATKVLWDTRLGTDNVLAFAPLELIKACYVITDTDNGIDFLVWADSNEPRCINIDRAKTYADNGFSEEDIVLIKAPPLYAPSITLALNSTIPNNILEEFLEFSYRYKYFDGFYSPASPFSPVAFEPGTFKYDYRVGNNESMVNQYNQVDITFNTGGPNVEAIELIFKRSGDNRIYVINTYDKADLGYANNGDVMVSFTNDKRFRTLPSNEIGRFYDRIPRQAKAMAVIDSRIVYLGYVENYNLRDENGNTIMVDLSLSRKSTSIPDALPVKSVKSIRNYEAVIVYMDKYGRPTTGLSSPKNAVEISPAYCNFQNSLSLTVKNKPPAWATHYRIFLRQARVEYDVITPVIFYQDGVYTWIRLEGNDQDKVNVGDFVYVKSDTTKILTEKVQTEILEKTIQQRNFLEASDETEIIQQSGVYIKVKPQDYDLNLSNAKIFNFESRGFKSRSTVNDIGTNVSYIEPAVYYGVTGLNDITATGSFTGTEDLRFEIEIDAEGAPDTFQWRTFNTNTGAVSPWITGVNVSTAPVALSDNVSVEWAADTGHVLGDNWIVSAKSNEEVDYWNGKREAWVPISGKPLSDESIESGATIRIKYAEKRDDFNVLEYDQNFISSQTYANIEEWFFGDNIISQLLHPKEIKKVLFRRGTGILKGDDKKVEIINIDSTKQLWMLFVSSVGYSGGERISVTVSIEITEFTNNIILETKPIEEPEEIYYEVGQTYLITGGNHMGAAGDTDQTASNPAVLDLPFFNCFAWNNGFESYKLRDKLGQRGFNLRTRPVGTLPEYRENNRIAGMIWGERYSQDTNYNGLNEFNPAVKNWIDLDDKYGEAVFAYARTNNLVVFQRNKITPVGYFMRILYDQNGNSILVRSDDVFSPLEPYAGEYGMSDPSTFAVDGNRMYWVDSDRNQVLRFGGDGISAISKYGMKGFFRDEFTAFPDARRIGEFDPFTDQYALSSQDRITLSPVQIFCGGEVIKTANIGAHQYTFTFGPLDTRLTISYDIEAGGQIDIDADWDGNITSGFDLTGIGAIVVDRTSFADDKVIVTVTPDQQSTYSLQHSCESLGLGKVKVIVINDDQDAASGNSSMVHRYNINAGINVYEETVLFDESGISLFKTLQGFVGSGAIPDNADSINLEVYSALIADHRFNGSFGNQIGYLVSQTDYSSSDIATIIAGATFPAITQTDASGARTNEITFTFNKANSDDILYLVFDYENKAVDAVDDNIAMFRGATYDINPLANDIVYSPFTLEIETPPAHGTATVINNQFIRYIHDGGADASDSIVYRITNEYNTDTATVSIVLTLDIGVGEGGGSGTNDGLAFQIATPGNADPELACPGTPNITKYHDGVNTYPTLDDFVYNDLAKNNPFDGQNLYYKMENGYAIRVNGSGRIQDYYYCTPGGGGGSA